MGRICFASQWARKTYRQDFAAGVVYGAAVGRGIISGCLAYLVKLPVGTAHPILPGLVALPFTATIYFGWHCRARHLRSPHYTQVGCEFFGDPSDLQIFLSGKTLTSKIA